MKVASSKTPIQEPDPADLVEVKILLLEEIKPSADPTLELALMIKNVNSADVDWIETHAVVDTFRRFTCHHRDMILPCLPLALPFIIKTVTNLRSALCKNAILALHEGFISLGSSMHCHIDNILLVLVKLVASDKKFLSSLSLQALEALVDNSSSEVVYIHIYICIYISCIKYSFIYML